MNYSNYKKIDCTFEFKGKLLTLTCLASYVIIGLLMGIHFIIWGKYTQPKSIILLFIVLGAELILLPFAHEYIHAITYMKIGNFKFSSVKLIYKPIWGSYSIRVTRGKVDFFTSANPTKKGIVPGIRGMY